MEKNQKYVLEVCHKSDIFPAEHSFQFHEDTREEQLRLVRSLMKSWEGRFGITRMSIKLVTEEEMETWERDE